MPTANNPLDKVPCPDYSLLDKEQSTTNPRATNTQQLQSRSTATTARPNYSHLDKEQSTTKPRDTKVQQSQSRSTATTARPDCSQYEKEHSTTRAIYRGPRRKLVLAFDVGTTYSGISYR